ncbi:branched-chain amino acid ABC transporter substrate-binding protein [Aquabacterium sp. A08]|uniref:branched-chain amino acid ABC transporter substrate-binding protein n=1 Tax=Aquabacterium sp. A08 TaxID=2718532 RepID=UPI001420CDE0|nr:branched-chain amino acid ABC transporter substrate-binding protein [Aquabacterium sp. A08]NIC41202.1 branched-chain amino acid ABC transporter substrate-binding protein [Aquabacterium sp. A08]NIC41224.1 branched-chain amino acid ABC transporter substrate-binding protein [Aquabacterium sp. A08]NIC41245.1 branched-chain amino acid ABC transporter substrate-binding protein [Aquabacterium sp. A08]
MYHQLAYIALAAALSVAACSKTEDTAAPANPGGTALVVKIGHVGATSGAVAHLGKDNENGARMAIEELNAAGVKIGEQTARFELVAEDDAADPKQGTAAAQKLADAQVNGVVGHLTSGTTLPASQIYNSAGIPQITPSSTNPKLTRQGYAGAFRLVADDVQQGSAMGRYTVESLQAKTVAVIDDRTAYGQGLADEFEKAATAAGAQVVAREFTNDKATDFNAILTSIKAKKPDAIFFGGMDAVGGPMLRQMRQLGMPAKLVGGDGLCTGEMIQLAAEALGDGQVYCVEAGGVDGDEVALSEKFRADYKAKYNLEVQAYAPYAYDGVKLLAQAMETAGSADPAQYLPALKAIQYQGASGKIAFDAQGNRQNAALTLYTFKAGQRERLAVIR